MCQYIAYVDFLASHSAFLEQTLSVKHDEIINMNEWNELERTLNGFPGEVTLSRGDWQKRLTEWRYSLNMKHRKFLVECQLTGGGENKASSLKDYEQRALQLFGGVATAGNPSLTVEAGVEQEFLIPIGTFPSTSYEIVDEENIEYLQDAPQDTNDAPQVRSPEAPRGNSPATLVSTPPIPVTRKGSRKRANQSSASKSSGKRARYDDGQSSLVETIMEI